MYMSETGGDWINLAQETVQWRALVNTAMNHRRWVVSQSAERLSASKEGRLRCSAQVIMRRRAGKLTTM
jgi:hypothetical protein